jgi:hypothetical protein
VRSDNDGDSASTLAGHSASRRYHEVAETENDLRRNRSGGNGRESCFLPLMNAASLGRM